MSNFLNDFNLFFTAIFNCLTKMWNWFFSTVIGEVILFTILISLFLFIIYLIIDFKN